VLVVVVLIGGAALVMLGGVVSVVDATLVLLVDGVGDAAVPKVRVRVLPTAPTASRESAKVSVPGVSVSVPGAATSPMRRKSAGLPAGKTFDSWREADSSIPPGTQSGLATLEWIGRAENLAVAGPSGTGKSHFVEAIAHKVIDAGMRVAWFTLESLTATIGGPPSTGRSPGPSPGSLGRS
jgi:IstB-like ATP binding protein